MINKKRKFKAQFHDLVQASIIEFGDVTQGIVIDFSNQVKDKLMFRAVQLMLYSEPILSSKFVEGFLRAKWVYVDPFSLKDSDVFEIIKTRDIEKDTEKVVVNNISNYDAPQVKIIILRGSKNDRLIGRFNHMTVDGAAIIDYIIRLSSLYNKLREEPNFIPGQIFKGDRSLKQVLKLFSFKEKLKIFKIGVANQKDWTQPKKYWNFPKIKNGERAVIYRTIDSNGFKKIKDFSKKLNVTINEVLLGATYRAYFDTIKPPADYPLRLLTSADLRRYLPDLKTGAFCNLSALIYLNIGTKLGKNLEETVKIVHDKMEEIKDDYIGLGDFLLFPKIVAMLPYKLQKSFLMSILKYKEPDKRKKNENPLIPVGISNAGKIPKLKFAGLKIEKVFGLPPMPSPPVFALLVSSYENTITFSAGYCRKNKNEKTVDNFFNKIIKNLPL